MSKLNSTNSVQYRPVPGYPAYRVGDDGSVWNQWKQVGCGTHHGSRRILSGLWKLKKPYLRKNGYLHVFLYNDGTRKGFLVNNLILTCFVGPCLEGYETRHLNNIRNDNRLINLAWGTCQENADDKTKAGRQPRGEKHGQAKLTNKIVIDVRHRHKHGESVVLLAIEFNVSSSCIRQVITGKSWKHILMSRPKS